MASLIGDPVRALMLSALMDGRSRTAGELAELGGITPQTASAHLAKLVDAGLLLIERQGRHRYHRLASSQVSHALESLMTISAGSSPSVELGTRDRDLRRARSCYDHMAGELAVRLADCWIEQGWLACDKHHEWHLTGAGRLGLQALAIELPGAGLRRPQVRSCLDWSERRPHIAGQLGACLLQTLLSQQHVRRRRGSRALLVSDEGERILGLWMAAPQA